MNEERMSRPDGENDIRLYEMRVEEGLGKLQEGCVDLIVCDPPYNISVQGGEAWDKMSDQDYMKFSQVWMTQCVRVLRPGGALLLYGSPCRPWIARFTLFLIDHLGMKYVQDMPWCFTQGGDSRMTNMREYAVRHERLVWFEKPESTDRKRTFNATAAAEHYSDEDRAVALKKGKGRVSEESLRRGRPPRTYIDIPRENSRSKERLHGKHPSMKPLTLCQRHVSVHSNENELVLVPFVGSGSEVLAAAQLHRRVIGFEISSEYMRIAQRRIESHGFAVSISK